MKKMNKTYEAPEAEMIEMQMPTVLMASVNTHGGGQGDDVPPIGETGGFEP
jgi:hypothetical protein